MWDAGSSGGSIEVPPLTDRDWFVRPAGEVEAPLLSPFASAVWPGDPEAMERRWWRRSHSAAANAAFDRASGKMVGLCVGIPSTWHLPSGHEVSTVSVCDWFVHPEFVGKGIGKWLVSSFSDRVPAQNALSISDAAVQSFKALGWFGPFPTHLRLLPLPGLQRLRALGDVRVRSWNASAVAFPSELAALLDLIDGRRPAKLVRRRRRAEDWRAHLSARPTRGPRFHVMFDAAGDLPLAYWVIRGADGEAGRQYRLARLHYVSDLVVNSDDPALLAAVFRAVPRTAPPFAGALLLCVSDDGLAMAAKVAGWLHEGSAVVGQRLADKAPRFMLGGELGGLQRNRVHLTFADSDVDLNI